MRPPIVINENGALSFFKSLAEAECYLEPIDVRNQEYAAYDSEGRRLDLRVEEEVVTRWLGLRKKSRECVRIVQAEERATHMEELKNMLRVFLQKLGTPPDSLHSATLQDLIASALSKE